MKTKLKEISKNVTNLKAAKVEDFDLRTLLELILNLKHQFS